MATTYLDMLHRRVAGDTERTAKIRVLLDPSLLDRNPTEKDLEAATIIGVVAAPTPDQLTELLATVGGDAPAHQLWRTILKHGYRQATTVSGKLIPEVDATEWAALVDALSWGELQTAHQQVDELLASPDFPKPSNS